MMVPEMSATEHDVMTEQTTNTNNQRCVASLGWARLAMKWDGGRVLDKVARVQWNFPFTHVVKEGG